MKGRKSTINKKKKVYLARSDQRRPGSNSLQPICGKTKPPVKFAPVLGPSRRSQPDVLHPPVKIYQSFHTGSVGRPFCEIVIVGLCGTLVLRISPLVEVPSEVFGAVTMS